jgi:valyl-tRNA synthetase
MDKVYSPAEIEQRLYQRWEASGLFAPQGDGPGY